MQTMQITNQEMLRANPHIQADMGREYTAKVKNADEAKELADKLKVSYFELDGVFYGRTNRGWNEVR